MPTIKQIFITIQTKWHLPLFPLIRGLLRLIYRMKVVGDPKKLQDLPNLIIVANHASFIDPPLLLFLFFSERLRFLARDSLFKVPVIGYFVRLCQGLPIKRGAKDVAAIKMAVDLLKDGKQIVMFPEGTRSLDGQIAPFKRGVGLIASMAHSTILPVYLHNTWKVWPKTKWPRPCGKLSIRIGEPMEYSVFEISERSSSEAQAACIEWLENAVAQLRQDHLSEFEK